MIDYKQSGTHVKLVNKTTNEIIASGLLTAWKDLPELLISFDARYFFVVRENPLYTIEIINDNSKVEFDKEKFKDYVYPYKGMEIRNNKEELIFREFDINELDPEIAPLVYALNNAGYKTTGSCCGHGGDIAWIHTIFENFLSLKNLVKILEKDQFKFKFKLSTDSNITNTANKEIRLSLETTKIGKEAYKDILELTEYIENKSSHLLLANELKI